jgi:hypothetical protein
LSSLNLAMTMRFANRSCNRRIQGLLY